MGKARLVFLVAWTVACGQSDDVLGGKPEPPPEPPPEDTGWITDFEACATQREEAALLTTSLLLAVDSSCSMDEPLDPYITCATTGTVTKWDAATTAFTTFFQDPSSATLDVALRFWPTPGDGCDDVACDAVACSVPLVPLGSVGDPAHQQALVDAFVNQVPEGGTPMSAALAGAAQWGVDRLAAAPDEQVAIVFVTDGEPNGCDEDIAVIAAHAATAAAAGVPVYAVGIEGSQVAQMDQIAQAGGTTAGYFVGNANAEADLLAALQDIQARAVSCEFAFPTESTGEPLSPDLIRVEYTIDGELVLARRLPDAAACGPDGGWYLDDPDDPTTITLCPSTCSDLQGIASVAIEIDVGCECVADSDCPGDEVCGDQGCIPPCEGDACPQPATPQTGLIGDLAVQGGAFACGSAPGSVAAVFGAALIALGRRRAR